MFLLFISGRLFYNLVMNTERKKIYSEICEWLDSLVWALAACVLFYTLVGSFYSISGTSMVPTYQDGSRVFAVIPYTGVQTGDVVDTDANNGTGECLIKRVIATEGQTVSIDSETGAVYVDGVLFDTPLETTEDSVRGDLAYPFVVPEDEVFLMGDNRSISWDSRYSMVGTVDEKTIVGKVLFTLGSGR